ncbi:uncharacterized protein TNCV_341121 [Trichonephila clavipes]|uniref:CCHC-type domain-containing protein n=1 Tax=Trichonephila clavipes TaxID=2585209 RepID=A0A8X6SR09_TRICX|nr:uncharacterized protein TNCV_341121 [Trichonephila clavipes]
MHSKYAEVQTYPEGSGVAVWKGRVPTKVSSSSLSPSSLGVLSPSFPSSRVVISEPDLLSTPEAEILDGFSDQGVIQVRRITIKKDATIIPTKHLILTFNSPKLPCTIKAGYLNCKIRPYIPNPLRCFKCQRFGHSQTSCRGQLTCSRCATVGHSSTDCTLEPKCVNCMQSHPSDSKLCQKWKLEKQIQEIKTNKNISYFEARKLIVPQLTQTTTSSSMPEVSTSSSSAQTHLLPSTSAEIPTIQSKSLLPIPIPTTTPNNNLNTSASSLETETRPLTTSNKFTALQPSVPLSESATTTLNSEYSNTSRVLQNVKQN